VTLGLSVFHKLSHGLTHLGWVVYDLDAVGFETGDLRFGITLSSRDDSTSMAHSSAWWSSLTSNETYDWQVSVIIL